jgi:hypothetical protein
MLASRFLQRANYTLKCVPPFANSCCNRNAAELIKAWGGRCDHAILFKDLPLPADVCAAATLENHCVSPRLAGLAKHERRSEQ